MLNSKKIKDEYLGRVIVSICGVVVIFITLAIGVFLLYKGLGTFTKYNHTVWEFLFSSDWSPQDGFTGGGSVGSAVYIYGSLVTCGLALAIAVPFSLLVAIFITEIQPKFGDAFLQPAIEIFVGIPSVVYGWVGLTVLVHFIQKIFDLPYGFSVLAAGIVLAVMIFPSVTSVASDAIKSVSEEYKEASYALGATRWQTIYKVIIPSAKTGIFTGVILGLTRAIGEALAVAMVIGKMRWFPDNIFSPTINLTSAIASDMGGAAEGGEYNLALWTMALLLFLISFIAIISIHFISSRGRRKKR